MSDDVASHTLTLLRELRTEMRDGFRALNSRMTALEHGQHAMRLELQGLRATDLALDGATIGKQDEIDAIKHRLEHLEDAAGSAYRVPSE